MTVYRDDTRVRVEVRDDGSDEIPVVRPRDDAGDSGYGLGLVELMAHRWGHRGGRRGRMVWFMLSERRTAEACYDGSPVKFATVRDKSR